MFDAAGVGRWIRADEDLVGRDLLVDLDTVG